MKILVGLSGGVDSAVSALLLKQAGHEVHAGFMINYLSDSPDCTTRADMAIAKAVAEFLKIPFFTFDYQAAYEERIIAHIYAEYARGITPNPDVLCNNLIKFDLFASEAQEYGYDHIAMGHYVQIFTEPMEFCRLHKGVDPAKDQSYFLSRLSKEQLSYALFPIGGLCKSEVRKIAIAAGLPNAERKDSQGLCFIGKVKMQDFLGKRIASTPGPIITTTGDEIGTHLGIHNYTIGQRKGIELGGGPALFVINKIAKSNTLIVGPATSLELLQKICILRDWASTRGSFEHLLGVPLTCKIRYRQIDIAVVLLYENQQLVAHFDEPQRAVAPGQFLVVYQGNEVIGSAIIC